MANKVIIVGAGIAGMTAGIYAQRSGFDVTILEQHSIPGGFCTSWKRKGYLFEGAMHWMTGSGDKNPMKQLWREVGALPDGYPVRYDEVFAAVDYKGQMYRLYRDVERTHRELLALAPQDKPMLDQYVKDVKGLAGLSMPVMDIKGVKSKNPQRFKLSSLIKMMPAFMRMGKLSSISNAEYAARFTHPALRLLMNYLPAGNSAMSFVVTMATLNYGDGGYPEGGSLAMTQRMAKLFTDLGGTLRLNTAVKQVVTENGAARGVLLENGDRLDADAVIVTLETVAAADRLFETPPTDAWIDELRRTVKPMTCTYVSVGVRAELPEVPQWVLDRPIECGGIEYPMLGFNSYADYPGYAPAGCTALTTALMGDNYEFWKKAKDEGRYEAEKEALADRICAELVAKYPQLAGKIDVIDIATPVTYERYTGATHGSWMAIMGAGDKQRSYPMALENVSGVYFAGHRATLPGGQPVALTSGRQAAQMVCRQFDTMFVNA